MQQETHQNPELELAFDYVCLTNQNIFLTGKAGTGKTTFLHRVQQQVPKRMAVVAPTGVAAINAKGVTIHSLFQLPFGSFIPGQTREADKQRKMTRRKINLIRGIDLLIIDEISMVRADLLDAIDGVLRRYKNRHLPFGGTQLLMIGDLHQLPPVVKPNEWDQLREHYDTPYFFGSLALRQAGAVTIQLKHIYRQSDAVFIDLLNKVRNNQMDAEVLTMLNSRYRDNFKPKDNEGYITLTSHNRTANQINEAKLKALPTKPTIFQAKIENDFPESAYPTEQELPFKVGAQVLFIKNDSSPEKRYYNGKIGKIIDLKKDSVQVQCGDEEPLWVYPEVWENRKYDLNKETKEVSETVIGRFEQMPLKLAWAITIHKSQGLTFEKVIIDAAAAFAHGQVYVALSRCKTFEGVVLRSKLDTSSVRTDQIVQQYSRHAEENSPTPENLDTAKRQFQTGSLRELFDFTAFQKAFAQLHRVLLEHEVSLKGNPLGSYGPLSAIVDEQLMTVGQKFIPQLTAYCQQQPLPEDNPELQERLRKAAGYFTTQLEKLTTGIEAFPVVTDNQSVKSLLEEKLQSVQLVVFVKSALMKLAAKGFSSLEFVKTKTNAALDFEKKSAKPSAKKVFVPQEVEHEELYKQLVNWRNREANENELPTYLVATSATLIELTQVLPTTTKALLLVGGFGKKRAEAFGEDILGIVKKYCKAHQLDDNQLEKTSKKPSKPKAPKEDTKLVSLKLFQAGKDIDTIAKERGFVRSTIMGHLAHWVGDGTLELGQVVDKQSVSDLSDFMATNPNASSKDVFNHFNGRYDYQMIKLVGASVEA